MQCPKCRAPMQTYNRGGVQIEQCGGCRGIFLDYGELEALTSLESQWSQQPPPAQPAPPVQPHPGGQSYPAQPYPAAQPYAAAPAWGAPRHGQHGYRGKKGFGRMLFSS